MIVPQEKRWIQPNKGTSEGNVHATWNVDFDANRGHLHVSNPLKKVFDTTNDAQLTTTVANSQTISFVTAETPVVTDSLVIMALLGGQTTGTGTIS